MSGRLAGRVAIVTGAASGIGRASALRFAAEGATLVLGDTSDAVHAVAEMCGTAVALTGDAGEEAHVAALVARALSDHGRIDVAFANAGVSGTLAGLFDTEADDFAEILRVNLIGPWLMVKHAGKAMWDGGAGGSIILTASVAGLRSGAGPAAYSASKAGVINLAAVAAQQLSGTGVRVNALCPGLVETGMTRFLFDLAAARGASDRVGRLSPARRAAQPSELAEVALFLASDAASFVNGQAIVADGGLSSSIPFHRQDTGQTAF